MSITLIRVRTRSQARAQFLSDILTTAVEGGMSYWAIGRNCVRAAKDESFPFIEGRDNDSPVGTTLDELSVVQIDLRDAEDDEDPWHTATLDTVAAGIRKLLELENFNSDIKKSIREANRTNGDEGDYDALDADAIVQLGLFGEIVYG